MPQLDLDLLEDFLFVAFAGLLLGVGDEETEENVIARGAEAHLGNLYVGGRKALRAETRLVASAVRVLGYSISVSNIQLEVIPLHLWLEWRIAVNIWL